MFDFKQSKNNIKIHFDNNQLPLKLSPTEWKLATSRSEMEIHMNTTDNLEQFLPILRTASIFRACPIQKYYLYYTVWGLL